MSTKAEVRQRVGEDLGLVPIGQDLEAQDQARIDATFGEVYDMLKEKGLATWATSAEVPDKLVPSFVLLMSRALLNSYSVPDTRYQRIVTDAGIDSSTALLKLAELSVPEYDDTAYEGDF